MSTIAFVPYPESGHLNASLKLAKSLRIGGHRVVYLGLPDFADFTRQQGLEFVPIFEDLFPQGFIYSQARRQAAASSAAEREARNLDAPLLEAVKAGTCNPTAEIGRAAQSIKADLMLVDLLLPDFALIADQMGFRIALLNTQVYNPWDGKTSAYLAPPLWQMPELVLCPEAFDFPCVERKKPCHYVEASIDLQRRDVPFPWMKINANKPIVYCSFGSQSHLIEGSKEFMQVVIDAMALRPDQQLVLSTGAHLRPEEFQPLPGNVVLVKIAPQLELLKRASSMITHGGFNSVKEAIYFAVPMILFPAIRDHPAIAARVVYHGLGVRARLGGATVGEIQSMIERIEGDALFSERLEAMSKRFREVEGSGIGVEIVQSVLAGREIKSIATKA